VWRYKRGKQEQVSRRTDNTMAKIKMANNDLQNTTQKIKYWATRTPLRIGSFFRLKSSTYIKHIISICIQLITDTVHLAVIAMEINRLSFIAKWQKRVVFTKLDTYIFFNTKNIQRLFNICPGQFSINNFICLKTRTSCTYTEHINLSIFRNLITYAVKPYRMPLIV